jgi:hypothetical protein
VGALKASTLRVELALDQLSALRGAVADQDVLIQHIERGLNQRFSLIESSVDTVTSQVNQVHARLLLP